MMGAIKLAIALAVAALVALTAAQAPAAGPFLVPVGANAHGFGAFRPTSADHDNVRALRAAFGPPSSYRRSRKYASCVLRWSRLGITATVFQVGEPTGVSPCREAIWASAKLSDRRWHTARGVRPGAPERVARRAAVGCPAGTPKGRCFLRPVTLDTFRSDCAGGVIPAVRAVIRKGRVAWLEVRWRGCE